MALVSHSPFHLAAQPSRIWPTLISRRLRDLWRSYTSGEQNSRAFNTCKCMRHIEKGKCSPDTASHLPSYPSTAPSSTRARRFVNSPEEDRRLRKPGCLAPGPQWQSLVAQDTDPRFPTMTSSVLSIRPAYEKRLPGIKSQWNIIVALLGNIRPQVTFLGPWVDFEDGTSPFIPVGIMSDKQRLEIGL